MTSRTDRSNASEASDSAAPVPIRVGAPCPYCGADIEDLEFVSLPAVAIKQEMYDVCVVDTDDLPTPWQHPTAIAYHEDPDPFESDPVVVPSLGDD